MNRLARLRFLVALPAVAALVLGVLSGLARLGVPMPVQATTLAGVHGPLMIGGFFGTLIGLERAVALGRGWPYLGPLLSGAGALSLLVDPGSPVAAWLLLAAGVVMTLACASVWWHDRVAHIATLTAGAAAWALGNLVWALTGALLAAIPLWLAFLVLTIAGERLELSRFVPTPPAARRVFAAIAAVLLGGAAAASTWAPGEVLFSLGVLLLTAWLLRYDVARRTVRQEGLTRYIAVCLLTGYAWLGVAALLGLAGAFAIGSPLRDAALHSLLVGFVFAMVFGHAPIILPALTRLKLRWHRGFYLPLALLHATLAWRVAAVALADVPMRQHALIGNALALVTFVVLVLEALLAQQRAAAAKLSAATRGSTRGHVPRSGRTRSGTESAGG